MAVPSRAPMTFKSFTQRLGNPGRGLLATPNRTVGTPSNKPQPKNTSK